MCGQEFGECREFREYKEHREYKERREYKGYIEAPATPMVGITSGNKEQTTKGKEEGKEERIGNR